MTYKEKATGVIMRLQQIEGERAAEVAKIKSATKKTIGTRFFTLTEDDKQKALDSLNAAYDKEAGELLENAIVETAGTKKAAVQKYFSAYPTGSDEDRQRVADIVKTFTENTKNAANLAESPVDTFNREMLYHIENETVYALPYVLAQKDLFGKEKQTEELLRKVSPDYNAAAVALDDVNAAANMLEAYCTIKQRNHAENALERISFTRRIVELGYNPNITDPAGIIASGE